MKKLLSLALVAVMLLAMVPFAVSAAEVDLIDGKAIKLGGVTTLSPYAAPLSAVNDGTYGTTGNGWDGLNAAIGMGDGTGYVTFEMFDEATITGATITLVQGPNYGGRFWSPVLEALVDGKWVQVGAWPEVTAPAADEDYEWTLTVSSTVTTNQVRINFWSAGWCFVSEIDVYGTPVEGGKTAEDAFYNSPSNLVSGLTGQPENIAVNSGASDISNITNGAITTKPSWGNAVWNGGFYGVKDADNTDENATVYIGFDLANAATITGAEFAFSTEEGSGITRPYEPWLEAYVNGAWVKVADFDDSAATSVTDGEVWTYALEAITSEVATNKVRIGWYAYGWTWVNELRVFGVEVMNGINETIDFGLGYWENGEKQSALGLVEVDGGYAYVTRAGEVVTGEYWVTADNGTGLSGIQYFDENGVMTVKEGFVTEDDGTIAYYYDKNKKAGYLGLTEIDGDLYYINSENEVMTGEYWVTKDNGLGYVGIQQFGADGKMVITEGILDTDGDGKLECWIKNQRVYAHGLIEVDGSYYYIDGNGNVVTGEYYVTNDNGLGYTGVQTFGADGAMIIA